MQGQGLEAGGEGAGRGEAGVGVTALLGGIPHVEHPDYHVDGRDQDDGGQHDVVEDRGPDAVVLFVDVIRRAQDHLYDAVQHLRETCRVKVAL